MSSSNNINHYVTLILLICVFCLVTIYYKSSSTNIEIHISRFIPTQRGKVNVDKQVKESCC